ncbi:MAG: hypothetical protein ACE5PT_02410 [Gemmatimonadales bacterium]
MARALAILSVALLRSLLPSEETLPPDAATTDVYAQYEGEVAHRGRDQVGLSTGIGVRRIVTADEVRMSWGLTTLDYGSRPDPPISAPRTCERSVFQLKLGLDFYADPYRVRLTLRALGEYDMDPYDALPVLAGSLIVSAPLGSR